MNPPLSTGALLHVAATSSGPDAKVPITGVFQVLDIKQIQSKDSAPNAKPRHKARLGDGQYSLVCMLSSQVGDLILAGTLTVGAIVRITDFIINQVNDRKMFIAFNCAILEQYGSYQAPIIVPPHTDLVDAQKAAEDGGHNQQQQPPGGFGGNVGGYGAPPPPVNNGNGMYGGPPPQASASGYVPPGGGGGMYGGPPPPVNNAGPYGGPPPPQGGGMYGAPPPMKSDQQQQAGGGGGGMYGGPPPGQNNPYGAPPPQQQQGYNPYAPNGGAAGGSRPPANYQANGAIARDDAPPRFIPISALNPYTARWAIRARVTSKGELRRWTNVRGEGKVFSFDLLDKDGGEIRATAFGAEADKFFEVVEAGAIYQISKASLTNKRPQFNHTNHQYEIKLDRNSLVERVAEDPETSQIPTISYNFRRIMDLETAEAGTVVDIIGVVETCEPWQTITRRTGEETQKRSMIVRDDSGRSIEVTLWGALVNNPGDQVEQMVRGGGRPILAAKALRVGDYNGKTLSTVGASALRLDPMDLPAAQRVRGWYDGGGKAQAVNSLSAAGGGGGGGRTDRRTVLSAIKDENLGRSGKADWVNVSAVLDMIRTDNQGGASAVVYPSCPHDYNGRPCQKKMMDVGGGNWNCDRCQFSTEHPAWRYLVSLSACDHTGRQSLTAFGDAGDAIFGRSAAEVRELEVSNQQEFDRLAEAIRFTPFFFRLKVAEDNYNDEQRIKVSIYRMERITDYAKECGSMLQSIRALEAGQNPFSNAAGQVNGGGPGAAPAGGAGPSGYGGGGAGPAQYGGPAGGGSGYGAPPQSTNPYMAAPSTNPYGAPPHAAGGRGPNTPPPAGGGYGGAPPAAGGYNAPQGGGGYNQQQGGGYNQQGGGGYGGPPQQQGGGYNQQQGGGGYGGYQGGGGGGGGGWNGGPPQQQQGGGGGGMYGGPPPQQQQQQAHAVPPNAFW
ncbi:hypothetical protein HYH02_005382 [Chlamydomonas schloesseri]|uniref:Replication protein A subunit n=1 Tax=Chlamydomonas schloesseri TaxID=2026947 RepID=A0A836B7X9_9CHLO|nr:hypothetical protein HYH02_005382 [Chlamydomonas schloesseri]|eukprot:KAG2449859.1 hypothetical protein HYH02_005382 [Chlamydomonas schloesseri]